MSLNYVQITWKKKDKIHNSDWFKFWVKFIFLYRMKKLRPYWELTLKLAILSVRELYLELCFSLLGRLLKMMMWAMYFIVNKLALLLWTQFICCILKYSRITYWFFALTFFAPFVTRKLRLLPSPEIHNFRHSSFSSCEFQPFFNLNRSIRFVFSVCWFIKINAMLWTVVWFAYAAPFLIEMLSNLRLAIISFQWLVCRGGFFFFFFYIKTKKKKIKNKAKDNDFKNCCLNWTSKFVSCQVWSMEFL